MNSSIWQLFCWIVTATPSNSLPGFIVLAGTPSPLSALYYSELSWALHFSKWVQSNEEPFCFKQEKAEKSAKAEKKATKNQLKQKKLHKQKNLLFSHQKINIAYISAYHLNDKFSNFCTSNKCPGLRTFQIKKCKRNLPEKPYT